MKKRIRILNSAVVLTLILGSLCQLAVGQENQTAKKTRKGEFSGLAKLGIVGSQIHNDDFGGYNKLGGTAGIGVLTPISESWKFQLELNYAMRGSRDPAQPDKGDFESALFEAHYIDIPILFKSFLWKFEYEIGLCNGILLFERKEFNNYTPPTNFQGDVFNRYELGANLGVNLPITEEWICGARFHYSLTPAIGNFGLVNGFSLTGGAFHNAISFSVIRIFKPKN